MAFAFVLPAPSAPFVAGIVALVCVLDAFFVGITFKAGPITFPVNLSSIAVPAGAPTSVFLLLVLVLSYSDPLTIFPRLVVLCHRSEDVRRMGL